jgi:hypothetical protein
LSEYKITSYKSGAFEFDADSIRALIKSAQKFLGFDPTITIELQDDHHIEGTEFDLLTEDPYVRSKIIKTISVQGRAYKDGQRDFELEIGATFRSIGLSMSGDRDATIATREETVEILKGQEVWYSKFLSTNPLANFFILVTCSVLLSVAAMTAAYLLSGVPISPEKDKVSALYILTILIEIPVCAVLLLSLFPVLSFNFGRSARKVRSSQHWRMVVGVGVILAFAIGVLVNLFTNLLDK